MKKIAVICVLVSLVLTACFNGQGGNEALIILNLGGSTGNRTVWPHVEYDGILDDIVYKIVIEGPDPIEPLQTNETIITKTVTPGIYTITVEAWYLNNIQYARDSIVNVTIKAGPNTVSITLKLWMDTTKTYLIADGIIREFASLADALTVAQTAPEVEDLRSSDGESIGPGLGLDKFTVSISDREHLLNCDAGAIHNEVTIVTHSSSSVVIKHDPDAEPTGYIFRVSGDANLTLRGNIILEGFDNNDSALIVVQEGGIFNMYDNVLITGNKNKDLGYPGVGYGGGVSVFGIFNMHGGEISGNKADFYGGGVHVEGGGEFYMHDGKICDNEGRIRGGGVSVDTGGKFEMYGGTISGNEVTASGADYTGGGGVYIEAGAFFHKIQGDKGTIYGYGEVAGVDDESLWNQDLNTAHSVYLGNSSPPYKQATVWPYDSLIDVP